MKETFLYDIFPEVNIPIKSYNEEIFLAFILLSLFLFCLYHIKRHKKIREKNLALLLRLKNLDWNDARTSANRLEYYAPLLIENKEQTKALKAISSSLSTQKYHHTPPPLTKKQAIMIDAFISSLRVEHA